MSREPWCDMSDLPKSQCAMPCCTPPPPKQAGLVQTGFRRGGVAYARATTYSTCDRCGDKIEPDDKIMKTDDYDYWIHEECP